MYREPPLSSRATIGIDKNAKLHAQVSRLEAELIKLQTELRELRDNKRTAPILPMRAAQ